MIDFKFIGELEGRSLTAYVPDAGNSKSGITIASGFDLGFRSPESLPFRVRDKLKNYCGYRGEDAISYLHSKPLIITDEECEIIDAHSHYEAVDRLLGIWPDESVPFALLSDECQTVIASVSFQYGNLMVRTPNFWRQVTTGDWDAALQNLRKFGDRYPTRRNKEADLLESRLKQY